MQGHGSAPEFLAALRNGFPECLIVDLQMPEMNGLELHQHLLSMTILITAHDDAAIHSPPARDTFVNRLRKPLQDEALFSAIDRAIRLESAR
jgi:FixJ family two-component response regulator